MLLPTIFNKLNEKTLYIFGAVNALSIVAVWALYPESNQRTLEEMDLVFASDSIWTWEAERNFAKIQAENPDLIKSHKVAGASGEDDAERGILGSRRQSKVSASQAAVADSTDSAVENAEKASATHH